MTEPAKTPAPLPGAGGSYTRAADGKITPTPAPKKSRPKRAAKKPAKPAEKET